MPICPHCQQAGISGLQKWLSSPARPAKCRQCTGLSYVPSGRSADFLLLAITWLLVGGLLAALLGAIWPLLAGGLAGIFTYLRCWQKVKLLASNQETTEQAQGRQTIFNAITLFLISMWR